MVILSARVRLEDQERPGVTVIVSQVPGSGCDMVAILP